MNNWPEFTAAETEITLSDHPFYDIGYSVDITARHFPTSDAEYPTSFATHTFVYARRQDAEFAYAGAQVVLGMFGALAESSDLAYMSVENHLENAPFRVNLPE